MKPNVFVLLRVKASFAVCLILFMIMVAGCGIFRKPIEIKHTLEKDRSYKNEVKWTVLARQTMDGKLMGEPPINTNIVFTSKIANEKDESLNIKVITDSFSTYTPSNNPISNEVFGIFSNVLTGCEYTVRATSDGKYLSNTGWTDCVNRIYAHISNNPSAVNLLNEMDNINDEEYIKKQFDTSYFTKCSKKGLKLGDKWNKYWNATRIWNRDLGLNVEYTLNGIKNTEGVRIAVVDFKGVRHFGNGFELYNEENINASQNASIAMDEIKVEGQILAEVDRHLIRMVTNSSTIRYRVQYSLAGEYKEIPQSIETRFSNKLIKP